MKGKWVLASAVVLLVTLMMTSSCAPATVEVTKEVPVTVEVTRVVEVAKEVPVTVEVTRVVEVVKEVPATPEAPKAPETAKTAAAPRVERLEVGYVNVKGVQLGDKTELKEGTLIVNAAELKTLLEEDKRLGRVDINVANPGDKTRIARVFDVYEPRARTGERKGEFPFPGLLGPVTDAGNGGMVVLKGAAVVVTNAGAPPDSANPPTAEGKVIQMSGGGELSTYAATHNVVVTVYPAQGVGSDEFFVAAKLAGLRAAAYLGRTGEDLKPDTVDVYEWVPLPYLDGVCDPSLPKVVYVYMVNYGNIPIQPRDFGSNKGEPVLYGDDTADLLAMVLSPNDFIDGAIVHPDSGWDETYAHQNNPVIEELHRRHGKELCFAGVVPFSARYSPSDNERATLLAARQVADIIGADGAIISKQGGGAPQAASAEIAELLEKAGVKTVVIPGNFGAVIFNQPEVRAIVNTGCLRGTMEVEAVEQVIGFHANVKEPNLGPLSLSLRNPGVMDQLGSQNWVCVTDPVDPDKDQRPVQVDRTGAERAVDMVLARLAGKPFETEMVFVEYPPLTAAPAVKDISKAKIAIVSGGGLARKDDKERFESSACTRFAAYDISGLDALTSADWEVWHGGYDSRYIAADPHRLIPLPELRELEKEGKIGKLNDTFYSFSGLANNYAGMLKIASGLVPRLQADGVEAVIMVDT